MTTPPSAPVRAGLGSLEAQERLAAAGPNAIPEPRSRSAGSRALQQLRDPMILLLLAAALITAALADFADLSVIAAVILLNTTVGVAQELRAERAVAALRKLSAPTARALRDGRPVLLPASEIVPGDTVLVEAGDVVPADLELAQAIHLQVDEAAVTGESLPVDKTGDGELLAGTVVTRGRGEGTVTATGSQSTLGRIATLIADQPTRPTPLQRRLTSLARLLTIAVLAIGLIVIVAGLVQGRSLAEMVIVAVSLAVAAVPESMPAVVALALALGAHRMARRAAVVRHLPAVETLGSVTLIASDKTGTLTEGRMRAEIVWTAQGQYVASGQGYAPDGSIQPRTDAPELARILRDIALCNDANLVPPKDPADEWLPLGDPQEAALVALARRGGQDVDGLRAAYPRRAELPFDSSRLRMTTVHDADDHLLVVCKGAPEVLLDQLTGSDLDAAAEAAGSLAAQGYRVLAVADADRVPGQAGELEAGLRLAGLVGIVDPLRKGAEQVADTFSTAGVQLVLVTGDHPATASAIATKLGIAHDRVVTGDELRAGGFDDATTDSVFARTRPEQKLDLIAAWQDKGHVVAMTGDGVNDAPALRRADIGVAMGSGGTEVARQAADLVLVNDNLDTVAAAIEEGRRIYANVRRFLGYALSGGFAEVLIMVAGPFAGVPIPLLPSQILWINMLTHGLPGVAMGAEPVEAGSMRRAPRSPNESVLGGGLWRQIVSIGLLISLAVGGAAAVVSHVGGAWQSAVFATLGLAQLGIALALRARGGSGSSARFLYLAVAGALVAQIVPLYLPWLQTLLRLEPLALTELAIVVAFAFVPGLVLSALIELRKAR
ncbi:cation-translocating P-type ATPase [Flindersiella endophytica]